MMKFVLLAVALLGMAMAATPSQPVFDGDYSAFTTDELDISQGEYTIKGNEVCCSTTASQCKVETVDQQGKIWNSYKLQATRQSINGGSVITFINENPQYEYAVAEQANGSLVCQAKCPLEGQQKLEPLVQQWFVPTAGNGTTVEYKGMAAYPDEPTACGKDAKCQVWEAKTTLFKVVVMETDTYYVNVAGSSPVPVADVTVLTPFGEHIGTEKTLYEQFEGFPHGIPDSIFTFSNKENCPPPQQGCQQPNNGGGGNGPDYKKSRSNARNWANHITEKVKGRFAFDVEAMFQ